MKLADTVADHPKIVRAGTLLGGPLGRAEALALFVAGIGYARHFLTDGFIPDGWLKTIPLTSSGEAVAKVLSAPNVCLWKRVRGGYRIHDFHDWNDKASVIKQKREATRVKVAAWRASKRNGRA